MKYDRPVITIPEQIVQHEVAIGLLSEEEGLNKLLPRLALVRHLANDLDDDAVVGGRLGVDVVDKDFAVVVAQAHDLVVDFLRGDVICE